MFGLQHPFIIQLQTQRLCHAHNMHTIQDGWFIIRTMND